MKKNLLIILGIVLLIISFERFLSLKTSFFKQLELTTYDKRARIAVDNGPFHEKFKHIDNNIVVVSIDDYSINEISQHPLLQARLGSTFPWPRGIWADVVDFIEQGKPKAILFDIIFNNYNENQKNDIKLSKTLKKYDNTVLATSLNSPKYLVDTCAKKNIIINSIYLPILKSLNNQIANKESNYSITYPEFSLNLFKKINEIIDSDFLPLSTYLSVKFDNKELKSIVTYIESILESSKKENAIINSNYLPTSKPLNVQIDNKELDSIITYYSHASVPSIYTKYNTIGVVNKVIDSDSAIRTSQPIFKLIKNGVTYYMPSLSFAGFLKYMGEGGKVVIKNNELSYKGRKIPLDEKGRVNISWHGTGYNYQFFHMSQILLSKDNPKYKDYINPEVFKDKIVVLGRTQAGSDIHLSSVNPLYAGPEANATIVDNFINDTSNGKNTRKFVTNMPKGQAFILIVMSCFFIAFIGMVSKNALICFINSAGFIILYILVSIWVFAYPTTRICIPVIIPLYYLVMTGAIVFAYRFQMERAQKATMMHTFGKFVSPKVLSTILKNQEHLTLKSTKKRITVMFCDIKNFTTLSEKCDPEQLVNDLNELFNELVNIIFENNGTIDKFIGDCIMAYWGDPISSDDDAFMAVKTALEMKKKVNEMKIANTKENKIIFDVKIGINTGDALLGLSGSNKIMSYTAMGDAVNVASRLESNCSKLNRDLLISKSTYEDSKSKIVVLDAGKISVKGRDEQIEIFEPIGLIDDKIEEETESEVS